MSDELNAETGTSRVDRGMPTGVLAARRAAGDGRAIHLMTRLAVAAAVVASFLARDSRTYLTPELWAEDASDFLSGPLLAGARSIFHSITVNFHVFGRAIAWVAAQLPTPWTPAIYAWSSLFLFAAISTTFLRVEYSWLHENRLLRAFLVLALAAAPGTSEVVGSINCLPYQIAFWLAALLMRRPLNVGNAEAGLIIVAGLSSPLAIFPFGVAAGLYAWRREREVAKVALLLLGPIFVDMISNITGAFELPVSVVDDRAAAPSFSHDAEFLPALYLWLQRAVIQLIAAPLLGGPLVEAWMSHVALIPIGLVVLCAVLLWRVRRGELELVLLAIAFCAFYSMVWLSRSYSEVLLLEEGLSLWNMRYAFPLGPFAVLLWWRALTDWWGRRRLVASAIGLLLTVNHAAYWLPRVRGPYVDPTPALQTIDELRKAMRAGAVSTPQRTSVIPVQPENWATIRIEIWHP